jgi:kynurenine formamidase
MLRARLERSMKAPRDGKTEGWPAVTPEVVRYIAGKGVKHIAINAPSADSVDPEQRAMTSWSAANEGRSSPSTWIGVGQLPATGAFYVFLNPEIENNHGGPGRAIGILPVSTAQASN